MYIFPVKIILMPPLPIYNRTFVRFIFLFRRRYRMFSEHMFCFILKFQEFFIPVAFITRNYYTLTRILYTWNKNFLYQNKKSLYFLYNKITRLYLLYPFGYSKDILFFFYTRLGIIHKLYLFRFAPAAEQIQNICLIFREIFIPLPEYIRFFYI